MSGNKKQNKIETPKEHEVVKQDESIITAVEEMSGSEYMANHIEKPRANEETREEKIIAQESTDQTGDEGKDIDDDGPKSTTSKEEGSPEKELSSSPSLLDKEEFGILGESRVVNTGAQNTPNQEVVTVKFLLDNSETFASAFKITSNIQEVKERLSDVLNMNIDSIKLEKDGFDVDDWLPLQGLGVEPFGSLELRLTSTHPGRMITAGSVSEYIPTVDVITVHVWQDGAFKDVIVEIENQSCQKEWLGGYRNKLTKLEYHHASTQTAPRERKVFDYPEPGVIIPLLFHRDTQTPFPLREVKVDTSVDKATQLWRSDLYIPVDRDKILTSKPFQSYSEWLLINNVEEKVIKLQRAVRHWLHRVRVNRLMIIQKYLLDDVKRQRIQMMKEQAEKEEKIMTDPFPSNRDDFYMLYLMVGKWWQKEWQRICDMKTDEPKKAEFVALLDKEIKLLSAIEKHRIEVKQQMMKKQQLRFLEMSSRPLTFRNARGHLTTIDDPATQRAREFKEIYMNLVRKDVSPKDRIDFLLTLKQLMSNYTAYEYTKDITKLIDREINLIAIGTKDSDLKLLRKRIEQLYMDFLHQPQFNPKVASYKKPNWSKKHDALYKCTRCMKLLPASRYPVHTRMKAYTVCKSCDWLQNIGHQRIDMTPFTRLLKQVQTSEMQKNCYSSVCFVFQQIGMFFLTSVIWHGHSAISECRDLAKLSHVRWMRDVEWAPWNTILLTEEEATCHLNIANVNEFYNKDFIEAVKQKHILARIHFTPLLKTDHHLRSTGVWQNITNIVPPVQASPTPLNPQVIFKE
ncbi:hypothetical protein J6590_056558 [Homalodisca vitripennis]|nr:hypothetical protein J6590_056558 [Homalodisca vitripennis]